MTRNTLLLLVAVVAFGCASPRAASNDAPHASAHDTAQVKPHDAATHAAHMAGGGTAPVSDSVFAAVQSRGAIGMGVDQYTSTHIFEPRPDGGRIALQRNADDSTGAAQIIAHLEMIATAFAAGDFATPVFVHAGTVAGSDVMAARRGAIRYSVRPLPRGGELIITTRDSTARDAIHRFLAFQRAEHRAGDGVSMPPPAPQ